MVCQFNSGTWDTDKRLLTINGGCYVTAKRKWKRHYGLRVIGKTEDDKQVVFGSDVFNMCDSQGVPLEVVLERFKEENKVVSWCDYFEAGIDHNWTFKRILSMIEYTLDDVYGHEYSQKVLTRIRVYVVSKVNGAWELKGP